MEHREAVIQGLGFRVCRQIAREAWQVLADVFGVPVLRLQDVRRSHRRQGCFKAVVGVRLGCNGLCREIYGDSGTVKWKLR